MADARRQAWDAAMRIGQSEEWAREFMEGRHLLLNGQRPYIVALQTEEGAQRVLDILLSLEAGVAP